MFTPIVGRRCNEGSSAAYSSGELRLVRESNVAVGQAARDFDVHEITLRNCVKAFAAEPDLALRDHGQLRPECLSRAMPEATQCEIQ